MKRGGLSSLMNQRNTINNRAEVIGWYAGLGQVVIGRKVVNDREKIKRRREEKVRLLKLICGL